MPYGMNNITTKIRNLFRKEKSVNGAKNPKRMYSIAEASEITGVGKSTIYALVKSGTIPSLQLQEHGNFRIADTELEHIKALTASSSLPEKL